MARKKSYVEYPLFNPLDKRHLGESAANALLGSDVFPLPPEPFIGAGVYALYYTGDFPTYKALADVNRDGQFSCPIYVGKAVPKGARKGGQGDAVDPGHKLYDRLNQHAQSVIAAANLNIEDFYCRFLCVDAIWIPLIESMMIEHFKPVWNVVLDGFGNHNPGSGRHSSKMSRWDCLHSGRKWEPNLAPGAFTAEELEQKVRDYLATTLQGK